MNIFSCISFFLIINLATANGPHKHEKSAECEALYQSLGKELEFVFFLINNRVPHDLKTMDQYCLDLQKSLSLFKRYSKHCLSSLARQVNNVMSTSLRKLFRFLCKSEVERLKTIELLACANSESLKKWKHCAHSANRQFDYIGKNSTIDELMGDMCCMDVILEACTLRISQDPSCDGKNLSLSKFLIDLVNYLLKDIMETACHKYSNYENCMAHNPKGMKILNQIDKAHFKVEGPMLVGPLLRLVPKLVE